jgi:hypothetical protein
MIASLFSKTRPINYVFTSIIAISSFVIYQAVHTENLFTTEILPIKLAVFFLLISSVFLVNFISLKNTLTKNDNYAVFLFTIFCLMFPSVFNNTTIVLSNFFLLLALRRLISLKSLVSPKEKIFDASFWIFLSAIFHFWSIIYILLVFISIIYHSGKDYKNWLIPFISFFCVFVLYVFFSLIFFNGFNVDLQGLLNTSFDFSNKTVFQSMALSSFVSISVLFLVTQILDYQNKPLNMQSSYKQIYFAFVVAAGIYIFSGNKSNDMLLYCFAPLSILGANMFEKLEQNNYKESSMYILLGLGVLFYFLQL